MQRTRRKRAPLTMTLEGAKKGTGRPFNASSPKAILDDLHPDR